MPELDILTHSRHGFVMMHLAGFEHHRQALARQYGLETRLIEYKGHDHLRRLLDGCKADVVMIVTDWSWKPDELSELLRAARAGSSTRRVVYFDCFDQTCSPYLSVLSEVDVYLKAKMLSPADRYLSPLAGGFVVTDFLHRRGTDLCGWDFGSVADPAYLSRLEQGWSFGYSRRIRLLLRLNRLAPHPWWLRNIDVHARFSPPARDKREWYEEYRAVAYDVAAALRGRFRVTPPGRIGTRRYYLEMRRCRMVFSPFGWGELCLRDYEAMASGCLLVKPDMGHVRTSPSVFEAGRTYVPVAWDLSDLGDVCDRMLSRPDEARAIARAGQRGLLREVEGGGFTRAVGRVLGRLGFSTGSDDQR